MPKNSKNGKNFKMWTKQTKKKAPKDILTEADDIISRLICETECNIECKVSGARIIITSVMCFAFAVLVAYVVIKY